MESLDLEALVSDVQTEHIHPGYACGVSKLESAVDEESYAAIVALIDNRTVQATALQKALAKQGHRLGAHVISRHRRGECRCSQ